MGREREDYRIILEELLRHFNKHWIYPTELAVYLGVDYRTVMRKFGITRQGCSIEGIAKRMSLWLR